MRARQSFGSAPDGSLGPSLRPEPYGELATSARPEAYGNFAGPSVVLDARDPNLAGGEQILKPFRFGGRKYGDMDTDQDGFALAAQNGDVDDVAMGFCGWDMK